MLAGVSGDENQLRAGRRTAARVALASVGIYVIVCAVIAAGHGGNAEWFVKYGRNHPAMLERARSLLGHDDIEVAFIDAHDGPLFWLIARDPLLLSPDESVPLLDRPAYRAQRILYPALAAPSRLFGEPALLWGMVVVNLVAVGIGTYVTAMIVAMVRAPVRAALAFPLNPAIVTGVLLDLSDVWATALLVSSVYAVMRKRWGWAVVAATGAVLSREVYAVGVIGLAIGAVGAPAIARVRLVAVPGVVALGWKAYVYWRLHGAGDSASDLVLVPFLGWLDAYRLSWKPMDRGADMVVAGVMLAVAVGVVVQWLRRRSLLLWAAVPFALVVPFAHFGVLSNATNSVRLLGAAITLLVVDAYGRPPAVAPSWPSLRRRRVLVDG